MKVPLHRWAEPRELPDDGWMRLMDAVSWVAWRGDPVPKYGSEEFADGTWVDFGDRDEEDQRRENEAAEKIRVELATGKLVAWSRDASGEPFAFPAGRWARALGIRVSDDNWAGRAPPILVEKAKVRMIWPPLDRARGRPAVHDWEAVRALAVAAIAKRRNISRNALADSLVAEYKDKVNSKRTPDVSSIRKKLEEWKLPPAE